MSRWIALVDNFFIQIININDFPFETHNAVIMNREVNQDHIRSLCTDVFSFRMWEAEWQYNVMCIFNSYSERFSSAFRNVSVRIEYSYRAFKTPSVRFIEYFYAESFY